MQNPTKILALRLATPITLQSHTKLMLLVSSKLVQTHKQYIQVAKQSKPARALRLRVPIAMVQVAQGPLASLSTSVPLFEPFASFMTLQKQQHTKWI